MTSLPNRRQLLSGNELFSRNRQLYLQTLAKMNWLRMLTVIIVGVIGLLVAMLVYLYLNQERIIFLPQADFVVTPEQLGLEYEEMTLKIDDEATVHGWYFPADPEGPTVLFCHGNAGNISHRLETARYLVSLGANILLFDYRGYGKATGSPTERGLYADGQAALEWLTREKKVANDKLVIFGRSLGGAVAVELATRNECRGLILESAFTSMPDMAQAVYPWLPVKFLVRHKLSSIDKIGDVKIPVLVMHSQTDEIIPYWMGRSLYEATTAEKKFMELEGAHNNLEYYYLSEYRKNLLWILNDHKD